MSVRSFINYDSNRVRSFTCCLCRSEEEGFGHTPAPLIVGRGSRCCDDCNRVVVFVRIAQSVPQCDKLNRLKWIAAIRRGDDQTIEDIKNGKLAW